MFIDHGNFAHTAGVPNRPSWAAANFTAQVQSSAYSCGPCGEFLWRTPTAAVGCDTACRAQMLYIAAMQNMSFGVDGGLSPACAALHPARCTHGLQLQSLWIITTAAVSSRGAAPGQPAALLHGAVRGADGADASLHVQQPVRTNANVAYMSSLWCHLVGR